MHDYKNAIFENLPYLRRYARALTDDIRLADRIVQQCVDCATDLQQLIKHEQAPEVNKKIWLFSIFHNIYSEFIEEQQKIIAQLPAVDTENYDSFDSVLENEGYYRALVQLPLLQKQIFLLVSVERFLYEEVSKIVNLPLGAVLSQLHTARQSIVAKVYPPDTVPSTKQAANSFVDNPAQELAESSETAEMLL